MMSKLFQSDLSSDDVSVVTEVGSGPFSASGLSTSYESAIDREWSSRIADLKRIRSYRSNWDEEGAAAPRPEVVDSVEMLFGMLRAGRSLPPPSRVLVSHEGGVVIEWQFAGGAHLEAECDSPYRAETMFANPNEPVIHDEWTWGSPVMHRDYVSWYRAA